MRDYGTS